MEKYICIHGHFYQPPRENAWLEVIEVQDSAHPYHDWNERIAAECYGPNTASRILNGQGIIKNILNNYSRISFNFGPTLLSWMEQNDPETYEAIIEADRQSIVRFSGHGSAMAQVYNHIIMPLATRRDKETQVKWGIRDFEYRFSRKPEGMWLAETAVDIETLEVLAENNISFTVLAPSQAKAFRKTGQGEWTELSNGAIDIQRPYVCHLPSGKSLALFFYHGGISQSVAFGGLLNDGKKFAQTLLDAFDPKSTGPQLVHLATDGETYGHHHRHGDMALAYCLDYIERNKQSNLTNYAEFLSKFKPEYEVQIVGNSSWSCIHGVERWRDNCGCHTGGKSGWNQQWRKPLRNAMDWLNIRLGNIFEKEASTILKDPWVSRNDYINVILKRNDDTVRKFMKEHCQRDAEPSKVLRMMEMQRNAMLMFTSCGWFFDEISGIETAQIMQYACRAIQLARQVSGTLLEDEFIHQLEQAESNLPAIGNGAQVYRKYVEPAKTNLRRVGIHYAVASLFEENPESIPVFNYTTKNDYFSRKEAGELRMVIASTTIKSEVTRSEKKFSFVAVYMGKHNILGSISLDMEEVKFNEMLAQIVPAFEGGRLDDVIGLLQAFFGNEKFSLWQLFKDEKRKILDLIIRQSMQELYESFRRIYKRDYSLVMALANHDIPIPSAYNITFEYILNEDLLNCFQPERISLKELERIVGEMMRWNMRIEDPAKVARLAGESIFKELRRISAEKGNTRRIERLNRLLPLLHRFNLKPNLYKSQNLYFEISRQNNKDTYSRDWIQLFNQLGDNLGVKVEM